MIQTRIKRVEVDGWVILDKPEGITSTHAVSRLKRIFNAKKAGHAGTLDPLASGILPIALGEATKTVPFVQESEKAYRFTVEWGIATNTDDAEGEIVARSDLRPERPQIENLLPQFIGKIEQTPPMFSAVKIAGRRAYDLARGCGTPVDLTARSVVIHDLSLCSVQKSSATFEARCGKGTYVRAIARDLGQMLGCLGHVRSLRRTRVGPFDERSAVPLATLDDPAGARAALCPVAVGLADITRVLVDREDASRLRRGQAILLRAPGAPTSGPAYATCTGVVIAVGSIDQGSLVPSRVFNLPF